MFIFTSMRNRLADNTGAVTEEFSFVTVVALAIVGALLTFFSKVPLVGTLLSGLFTELFNSLTHQIAGLFA